MKIRWLFLAIIYIMQETKKPRKEKKKLSWLFVVSCNVRKHERKKSVDDDLTDDEVWAVAERPAEYSLFREFFQVPFPAPEKPKFTFIDLFAGIGGFRIALQNLGGKCVYSSEFDAKAQETYLANYGEMPFGDITKPSTKSYISSRV